VRFDDTLEADFIVRAVAKRFVRGVTATAERDSSAPAEAERPTLRINDFEIPFYTKRAVVSRNYFRCSHRFLPLNLRHTSHSAAASAQYFGTEGSTSSDQARIPPFRFQILRKPARRRNSTASAERLPLRQCATISRELSSSFTRLETSPSGIR
jgi:hypothetical protein